MQLVPVFSHSAATLGTGAFAYVLAGQPGYPGVGCSFV